MLEDVVFAPSDLGIDSPIYKQFVDPSQFTLRMANPLSVIEGIWPGSSFTLDVCRLKSRAPLEWLQGRDVYPSDFFAYIAVGSKFCSFLLFARFLNA